MRKIIITEHILEKQRKRETEREWVEDIKVDLSFFVLINGGVHELSWIEQGIRE